MDRKSVLIVILLCLLCNSCLNYYWNDNGGLRPKTPHFRLAKPKPYQLKAEDQIDTMAIYIYKFPDPLYKTKESQMILRFFNNGRFSYIFDDKNYNNLKAHKIGYYRVENNNIVLLETFIKASPTAGDLGKYHQSVGIIKNDTLIEILGVRRFTDIEWVEGRISTSHHICNIYLKQKVDTLTGTPDW